MRTIEVCRSWVVYRMTRPGTAISGNVVCEQREWDLIEAAQPGYHTLLHSGLQTEQEAEKLARGTAGDAPLRKKTIKAKTSLFGSAPTDGNSGATQQARP